MIIKSATTNMFKWNFLNDLYALMKKDLKAAGVPAAHYSTELLTIIVLRKVCREAEVPELLEDVFGGREVSDTEVEQALQRDAFGI